jgi:hypothetical protein
MSDTSLLHFVRDSLGTGEGTCSLCGAYLSVTIPANRLAKDVLLDFFAKHLAERHPGAVLSVLARETQTLNEEETKHLDNAISKLILVGDSVGVTPEEMIAKLESGMSMSDLLAYLTSKKSAVA